MRKPTDYRRPRRERASRLSDSHRLLLLIGIMVGISATVTAAAIGVLYQETFAHERDRLVNLVENQALLIETSVRFDLGTAAKGGADPAGLLARLMVDSDATRQRGTDSTTEITIARRQGENILWLTRSRGEDANAPRILPADTHLAEPMRAALAGQKGTMIGIDYAARRVLAAYQPIAFLNLGIVATIEMDEINQRFSKAAVLAAIVSLVVIGAGVLLLLKINQPMLARLREDEAHYRMMFEHMGAGIAVYEAVGAGEDFRFCDLNRTAEASERLRRDEVIGHKLSQVYPEIATTPLISALRNCWQSGKPNTLPTFRYHDRRIDGWREGFVYKLPTGNVAVVFFDVSERITHAERLRASEGQYRALVEWQPELVCQYRGDTTLTFVNDSFARFFGQSGEALIGLRWIDLIPAEMSKSLADLAAITVNSPRLRQEGWLRRGDGELRWIVWQTQAFFDATGAVISYQSLGSDVTQHRQTEEALRESEARLRAVLDHSPALICIKDVKGNIILANPSYGALAERPEVLCETDLQAVASGRPMEKEETLLHRDGRARSYLSSCFPLYLDSEKDNPFGICCVRTDITERKQAEEALKRSESQFRGTFENAAVGIAHIAPDGTWLRVNQRLCDIVGYTAAELASMKFQDITHPHDIAADAALGEQLLAGKIPTYEMEKRYIRRGGEVIWVKLTVGLQRNENGEPPYLISFIEDIHARKEAEAALYESQLRTRALLDASQDEIILLTTEGRILAMNLAAEARIAAPNKPPAATAAGSAIGQQITTLLPEPLARAKLEMIAAVAKDRQTHHLEQQWRSRWHEIWIYPILRPDAPVTEIACYARDVTDRKNAEAEVRKLTHALHQSPVSVLITNSEGEIEYANPKFCDITGYSLDEVIGQNPRILKSGYTSKEEYSALWKTIISGQVWHGELQNRRKDESVFSERASIAPVRNEQGDITHFIALKEDITERKAMEQQLRQTQQLQALGQLTGGIAHDFNNLLAIIIGNLELLSERIQLDPASKSMLADALWSAQRGGELTHRLLAFARRQPLRPVPTDLNQIVHDVLNILRRTLEPGITVRERLAPDLWTAFIDRGELERAIVNLAVNGRDAMGSSGTLTIETCNVHLGQADAERDGDLSAGDYAMISLTDTGSGMAPEVMKRAFEPFFTTKEFGKGSGLGLSMVYGFAKQSGGHVHIDSQIGKGTAVNLYLPRAGDAETPDAVPSEVSLRAFAGLAVLLVEDDKDLRTGAARMLSTLGLGVVEAADGTAALTCLKQQRVDLVFTDLVLPGDVDGIQVADGAWHLDPELPVLFATGFAERALLEEQRRRGAGWIGKPYTQPELARALKALLTAKMDAPATGRPT